MQEIDELLKKKKRIHFIGIGGSGMRPLAELLHSEGYILSGSDNNESDNLKKIRSLGIPVAMGQRAENIEGAEIIIYTAALLNDNPELVAAKASGIPAFERSKLLGAMSRRYPNGACVAGTHGKTTVCAMLTQVLIDAGLNPTAIIGGRLPSTDSNGVAGGGEYFVCEACEFVDSFLELSPGAAVVLNVDEDHLDYFKTLDNLKKSFSRFASSASGAVIYNGDDENVLDALSDAIKKSGRPSFSFGLNEGDYFRAVNVGSKNERPFFDLIKNGEKLGKIVLSIPGKHNVYNALAVVAAATYFGVSFEKYAKAIAGFKGAGRRFEKLAEIDGITVVDDYAHHPKELEVTLKTAAEMGYKRVVAVFQPFTYSRTAALFDDFVRVLKIPDKCVLTEIMGSREINSYNVYSYQLAEKIPGSVALKTFEETAIYVAERAEKGDLIITLGCGDIYKAAKLIIKKLKEKR